MKKHSQICFIFGLLSCCLLSAKAAMWTVEGLNLGKINLQGSLSQQYNLGQLGPLDGEVLPIQFVHTLSPYSLGGLETFSKWEVPQLTTYVVPQGKNAMLWVAPGGQEILFKRSKDKDKSNRIVDVLPSNLTKGWTILMNKDSTRAELHSDEGWVYVYQDGELQTLQLPSGRKLYFETNLIQLMSISLREGGKTTVLLNARYDDLGRLSELKIGPTWHVFKYSGNTELLEIWMPFSLPERAIHFNYKDGLVSTIVDSSGRKETFQWQADPSQYSPSDGLRFERFKSPAILLADTDYSYRIGENQEGINLIGQNKLGQEERLVYNPLTKRLITVDRGGLRREMQWNTDRSNPAGDQLVGLIAPDGDKLVELEYDDAGRVAVVRKRGEAAIAFAYDAEGRVTERKRGDYAPFRYLYEANAETPSKVINPVGDSMEYSYREDGQLESFRDLYGGVHRFIYDEYGRLIRRLYPMDVWVAYDRDTFGRITGIEHSNGSKTLKTYDAFNQLQEVIADGVRWAYEYDKQGRVTQVMRNDDAWQRISYQSGADKIEVLAVDDQGNRTKGVYNLDGKLLEETNPLGGTINYSYDPIGQLEGWTDQEEGVIQFDYDEAGNITGQTNALDQRHKKYYDDLGRLRLRDSGEQKIEVEYDDAERITRIDYGNGQVLAYQYDAYGRIKETQSGSITTTFAYDALDRRKGKRTRYPDGSMDDLIFAYTPSGDRKEMHFRRYDSSGDMLEESKTNYAYDELGRLTSISAGDAPVATYRYDPETLLLSEKVLGNGNVLSYQYNDSRQVELISTYDKNANLLQSLGYEWNDRGQLVGKRLE